MASEPKYDAEAFALGLAMRLGMPASSVATISKTLRAAHEAGAREAAEVAVAEAYRCGKESGEMEMRERGYVACLGVSGSSVAVDCAGAVLQLEIYAAKENSNDD